MTDEEKKEIIQETVKQVKADLYNVFNNANRELLNNLNPEFQENKKNMYGYTLDRMDEKTGEYKF